MEKDQERAIQPIQIQDAMEEGFNKVCDINFTEDQIARLKERPNSSGPGLAFVSVA